MELVFRTIGPPHPGATSGIEHVSLWVLVTRESWPAIARQSKRGSSLQMVRAGARAHRLSIVHLKISDANFQNSVLRVCGSASIQATADGKGGTPRADEDPPDVDG